MVSSILFAFLSILAVLGAAGLVLLKHPMNGAMSFIITLVSLAGLYVLLSAKLIFAIQLIVYAGAIMSLILSIIMFLNISEKDLPDESGRWYYFAGGAVVIAPLGSLLLKAVHSLPSGDASFIEDSFGSVKEVGKVLFTDWLLPFEIVSILLLVALVGAVVLAGKKGGESVISDYLSLSVVLFCLGILGVISRRNVFTVFMSIELMLNAANLAFVALARLHESMDGHVLALMVMAVAAAEAALALAVVILLHKHKGNLDTNVFSLLKG